MTRRGAAVAVLGLVLGAGISKLINVVLCRVQRRDRKVCGHLFVKHNTFLKRTNRMRIGGMANESRQMGDSSARPTARGSPPPVPAQFGVEKHVAKGHFGRMSVGKMI